MTVRLGGQPDFSVALIDKDTGVAVDLFALVGAQALAVAVTDGAGNQVTSFGGVSIPTVSTLSNVASSATSVTVLAANAARVGAVFFNDSTQACYVKFGATASATSFTYKVFASQTLDVAAPLYRGVVDAIWDSANGNMRVTEMT